MLRWKSGGQAVVSDVEAVWEQLTLRGVVGQEKRG